MACGSSTITVGLLVFPICSIILCILLFTSMTKVSTRKIQGYIKLVYFISVIPAIVFCIVATIWDFVIITCQYSSTITLYLISLSSAAYGSVIICVVSMLLLRLYFTFKDSVFEFQNFIVSFSSFQS